LGPCRRKRRGCSPTPKKQSLGSTKMVTTKMISMVSWKKEYMTGYKRGRHGDGHLDLDLALATALTLALVLTLTLTWKKGYMTGMTLSGDPNPSAWWLTLSLTLTLAPSL